MYNVTTVILYYYVEHRLVNGVITPVITYQR